MSFHLDQKRSNGGPHRTLSASSLLNSVERAYMSTPPGDAKKQCCSPQENQLTKQRWARGSTVIKSADSVHVGQRLEKTFHLLEITLRISPMGIPLFVLVTSLPASLRAVPIARLAIRESVKKYKRLYVNVTNDQLSVVLYLNS